MAMKQKARREKKSTQSAAVAAALTNGAMASPAVNKKEIVLEDHLPPLGLVLTVILCSGFAWILGLRDLMATGKPFLGEMDHAYLVRFFVCMCHRICEFMSATTYHNSLSLPPGPLCPISNLLSRFSAIYQINSVVRR